MRPVQAIRELFPSAHRPYAIKRLAIEPDEKGALPTEFRLFVAGWNETENGRFLFDAEAAASVMAAWEAWGVDLMIDLEHQALDDAPSPDPTARDARGWCKLELREDGSLWAVDVTWTPDGADRLREKRQRYVSPAFHVDPETGRITKIINVAITAIPATHDTPALVAARAARDLRKLSTGPSFGDLHTALTKALTDRYRGPAGGPWIMDVFDASVVFELEGKLYEVAYTFDGSTATLGAKAVEVVRSYTPVTAPMAAPTTTTRRLSAGGKMDPKLIAEALDALMAGDADKCMEILKGLVASAAGAPAPTGDDDGGGEPAPQENNADGSGGGGGEDEEPEAVAAASARLMRLTGARTFTEAVALVDTFRTSHLTLEQERQRLAAERATMEAAERRQLCVELVTLGAEFPSTIWADVTAAKPSKLKPRWLAMPIDELRSHVAEQRTARGRRAPTNGGDIAPPVGGEIGGDQTFETPNGPYVVTARELETCRRNKVDPAKYAETRAAIRARSSRPRRAEV